MENRECNSQQCVCNGTQCNRKSCCGILHFWCFIKGANRSKPWYERNNCYGIVGGTVMVIAMLAVMGLLVICPIPYGVGLLMQVITGTKWVSGTDKIDYEYWMNVFLGWFGIMFVIFGIVGLAGVVLILGIIGSAIIKCIECWNGCAKDYGDDLEKREATPLISVKQEAVTPV